MTFPKCPHCGYNTLVNGMCMSCGYGIQDAPILEKDAAQTKREELVEGVSVILQEYDWLSSKEVAEKIVAFLKPELT